MKKANPFLQKGFKNQSNLYSETNETMTAQGTANKTLILLFLMISTSIYSWNVAYSANAISSLTGLIMFGAIGGLVFSLITTFKPNIAHITAPIYALLEGLAIGSISAIYEMDYPGMVINAVILTIGILFSLLVLYKSGTIKVTRSFRTGIIAATMGIAFVYIIDIVLMLFGISVPFIHSSGIFGIGVSVVIVIIASMNLLLDFDFIERGSNAGLSKHMEWYGAFGLMVTLVWLYLEILRLLAKLNRRK